MEVAVAVGKADLIFVTGRTKRANEDHFDANPELERALRDNGKDDVADMIRNIVPEGVRCIFLLQPEALGVGHAVPCAEPAVGREAFVVLLADDVNAAMSRRSARSMPMPRTPARSRASWKCRSERGRDTGLSGRGLMVAWPGLRRSPRRDASRCGWP